VSDYKPTLPEEEIDEIVTAEADDDYAWEPPIHVRRSQSESEEPKVNPNKGKSA